ncbi:ribonuclease H-like domain-containing protein [Neobacillus sp. LXY-1]|uniref:ribonuclease H-like domain-containing protein n=1 Tax=Neobacillus sp. LXY-1 TaxID=3379133 RepID=UPI003EDEF9D4
MSLKNKLNRLKPHLSLGEGVGKTEVSPNREGKVEIPFLERWQNEQVSPFFFDGTYCFIREVRFPLSHKHGHYQFADFLKAINLWNETHIKHPLSAQGFNGADLFFFDTETTGLGGGVGNTIFLLGYASVQGDHLLLRQHLLPNPGAEIPLYQSFLEKVNYKTLVTYNGKAFDWPQVQTRHTLVRDHVPKLPAFGHFDLFHAARRLWKHKLERLKLSIVEKEVLGIERTDDIPGYLAPMIYYDFIENKNPEGILGVMKHNEIDILSLVTLYTHLTFQLCGVDQAQTRMESYEVGRWFDALGEKQKAKEVLTNLMDHHDLTSCKAKLTLAYQYKKENNWQTARKLFEEITTSDSDEKMLLESYLELAKIHEHRIKNIELAIDYCYKAIDLLKIVQIPKISGDQSPEQFQKRLKRLEKKLLNELH